jgi:hypothetical protein
VREKKPENELPQDKPPGIAFQDGWNHRICRTFRVSNVFSASPLRITGIDAKHRHTEPKREIYDISLYDRSFCIAKVFLSFGR